MSLDFVSFIHASHVSIHTETPALREYILNIGGIVTQNSDVTVNYSYEQELAIIISTLQQLEIQFLDQVAGWPPAAVFDYLKEKGMASGKIKRI